jgi:pyruvate/2-oxoglutarate dehydrogenase complex dihydrolipoamide dehydrogenase (E3) component
MRETKGLGVYNIVIIGGGTAGLVAAAGTAGLGGRVALIERNKMGGDCLNYGCVPSKALIASARMINRTRHASKWGLDEEDPRFEFQTVFASMRSRRANVEKLNLDAAGVKFNSRGIEVNAYLQTSQPHIYAAGDIAGPYQFTHTADAQARVVVKNILMPFQMLRQKMDHSVVPWCTYTDPEIAHVGLNQTEAKQQDVFYDLISIRIDELDRAVVEREELGFVNVLTAKGTDKILGVTMVAVHAGDLLHEFVLAMKHRIGLIQLATTIHAYSTFAELGRKVGDRHSKKRLTPFLKKAFIWLYRRARAASGLTSPNGRAARNVVCGQGD